MNVLVCIKQVPDTTSIKIDPETNTLIREGVPSILNPFDGYALEAAARIKDANPETKIVVVAMGPEMAKAVITESIAIAADKGYLVSGREFGGSDTLATSYILSCAIKQIEKEEGKFDMIFCGKQAIDGDTAQVGPEIAEHLGLPMVTYGLEAELDGTTLKVKKELEDGVAVIGIQTPCLVTYTKPAWDPRFPTIKRKLAAKKAVIPTLGAADIEGIDLAQCGLKGSPTKVKKSFCPEQRKGGIVIKEATAEDSAKMLFAKLNEAGIM